MKFSRAVIVGMVLVAVYLATGLRYQWRQRAGCGGKARGAGN
ncbi:MAG: hypothetical protein U0903_16310 [Planctomycetales bacterium]